MSFNKLFITLCVAAGAVTVSPAGADPFLPVPPASFLNYHVSTARGLSEEVAQDVVVRARLARHFGLSGPAMVSYVQNNLVETTLTARQAGQYRVACISPSGRDYFITERLGAGTPVFALATTRQPILRLACGNPLVSALPVVAPKPHMKPAAMTAVRAMPRVVEAAPQMSSFNFIATPPLTSPAVVAGPIVKVAPLTQAASHGSSILPIAALGAVGIAVSSHGGTHPSVTPPTAAVPEPNSLLLVGLFGSVLAALQVRSWRARRQEID